MWLRHYNYGDLLDDRGSSVTYYQFDSRRSLPSIGHYGNGKSVHCLHESIIIISLNIPLIMF